MIKNTNYYINPGAAGIIGLKVRTILRIEITEETIENLKSLNKRKKNYYLSTDLTN